MATQNNYKEHDRLAKYLIELTKDSNRVWDMTELIQHLIRTWKPRLLYKTWERRIHIFCCKFPKRKDFTLRTKVKLWFGLSVPVSNGLLNVIRKHATVEVDEQNRITKYLTNNKSLHLEGFHCDSVRNRRPVESRRYVNEENYSEDYGEHGQQENGRYYEREYREPYENSHRSRYDTWCLQRPTGCGHSCNETKLRRDEKAFYSERSPTAPSHSDHRFFSTGDGHPLLSTSRIPWSASGLYQNEHEPEKQVGFPEVEPNREEIQSNSHEEGFSSEESYGEVGYDESDSSDLPIQEYETDERCPLGNNVRRSSDLADRNDKGDYEDDEESVGTEREDSEDEQEKTDDEKDNEKSSDNHVVINNVRNPKKRFYNVSWSEDDDVECSFSRNKKEKKDNDSPERRNRSPKFKEQSHISRDSTDGNSHRKVLVNKTASIPHGIPSYVCNKTPTIRERFREVFNIHVKPPPIQEKNKPPVNRNRDNHEDVIAEKNNTLVVEPKLEEIQSESSSPELPIQTKEIDESCQVENSARGSTNVAVDNEDTDKEDDSEEEEEEDVETGDEDDDEEADDKEENEETSENTVMIKSDRVPMKRSLHDSHAENREGECSSPVNKREKQFNGSPGCSDRPVEIEKDSLVEVDRDVKVEEPESMEYDESDVRADHNNENCTSKTTSEIQENEPTVAKPPEKRSEQNTSSEYSNLIEPKLEENQSDSEEGDASKEDGNLGTFGDHSYPVINRRSVNDENNSEDNGEENEETSENSHRIEMEPEEPNELPEIEPKDELVESDGGMEFEESDSSQLSTQAQEIDDDVENTPTFGPNSSNALEVHQRAEIVENTLPPAPKEQNLDNSRSDNAVDQISEETISPPPEVQPNLKENAGITPQAGLLQNTTTSAPDDSLYSNKTLPLSQHPLNTETPVESRSTEPMTSPKMSKNFSMLPLQTSNSSDVSLGVNTFDPASSGLEPIEKISIKSESRSSKNYTSLTLVLEKMHILVDTLDLPILSNVQKRIENEIEQNQNKMVSHEILRVSLQLSLEKLIDSKAIESSEVVSLREFLCHLRHLVLDLKFPSLVEFQEELKGIIGELRSRDKMIPVTSIRGALQITINNIIPT